MPVPTPAPAGNTIKIGLHVETPASRDILDMATRLHNAGKPLAAITILDDIGLANALAQVVRHVNFRSYPHGQQFNPSLLVSETTARGHGNYLYDQHWPIVSQLSGRNITVQFRNENSQFPYDNFFELQLMSRADSDGRFKVGLFGDSLGSPTVEQWQTREGALAYAMANGHAVILHEYGAEVNNQPAHVPMSDANTFPWYAGRHRMLYDAMPANCRPNLIVGECGCSDATPDTIDDIRAYNQLLQADTYVIGFCLWGAGASAPKYQINGMLPDIERLVRSL